MWAATGRAAADLGWRPRLGVAEMCRDQWAWARKHPRGYEEEAPGQAAAAGADCSGGGGEGRRAEAVGGGEAAVAGAKAACGGGAHRGVRAVGRAAAS